LEWAFLFAGGLTFAYMLKLFICIFVEKNAKDKVFHGHGKYIATPSAIVLGCYVVLMCCLGGLPNKTMDGIAAFARHFFHGEAPHHAVHYFSLVNLKGSAISLTIGALVYLLVVRPLLKRKDAIGVKQYIDPIPAWLNMENSIYRPLLTVLAQLLLMFAVLVDKLGPWIFNAIPRIVLCIYRFAHSQWGKFVRLITGSEYHPRPTLEQTVDDHHFARYEDHPQPDRGLANSFAFGLMLAGFGVIFAILFIFLH
jgi:hydrogenase-4 component B